MMTLADFLTVLVRTRPMIAVVWGCRNWSCRDCRNFSKLEFVGGFAYCNASATWIISRDNLIFQATLQSASHTRWVFIEDFLLLVIFSWKITLQPLEALSSVQDWSVRFKASERVALSCGLFSSSSFEGVNSIQLLGLEIGISRSDLYCIALSLASSALFPSYAYLLHIAFARVSIIRSLALFEGLDFHNYLRQTTRRSVGERLGASAKRRSRATHNKSLEVSQTKSWKFQLVVGTIYICSVVILPTWLLRFFPSNIEPKFYNSPYTFPCALWQSALDTSFSREGF